MADIFDYPIANPDGVCFGLLEKAIQDEMRRAVEAGGKWERFDGTRWIHADADDLVTGHLAAITRI